MDKETPAPSSFNVGTTKDLGLTCCRRPNFSWRTDRYYPRSTGGHRPPAAAGRFQSAPGNVPPRPLFDSATSTTLTGTFTGTLTRMHPFSPEVTFGAESFEYMCQFMRGKVKFKVFLRRVSIRKFDSTKNDLFVHWF